MCFPLLFGSLAEIHLVVSKPGRGLSNTLQLGVCRGRLKAKGRPSILLFFILISAN